MIITNNGYLLPEDEDIFKIDAYNKNFTLLDKNLKETEQNFKDASSGGKYIPKECKERIDEIFNYKSVICMYSSEKDKEKGIALVKSDIIEDLTDKILPKGDK